MKQVQPKSICCNVPNIILADGFYVCTSCGTVIEHIMMNDERRCFTTIDRNARITNEVVLDRYHARTTIDWKRDGKGAFLSPKTKFIFRRLTHIHHSTSDSINRSMGNVIAIIKAAKEDLHIPEQVMNDAMRICEHTIRLKLIKGRTIRSAIAASIYIACKIHHVVNTMKNIEECVASSHRNTNRMYQCMYNNVLPSMNIKIANNTIQGYINAICGKYHIPINIICRSLDIYHNISKSNNFIGKDPKGVAAGIVYIVCLKAHNRYSQRDLATWFQVTEVTLRNRYKDILHMLEKIPKIDNEKKIEQTALI